MKQTKKMTQRTDTSTGVFPVVITHNPKYGGNRRKRCAIPKEKRKGSQLQIQNKLKKYQNQMSYAT